MATYSAPACNSPTVQARPNPSLVTRLRNYRIHTGLTITKLYVQMNAMGCKIGLFTVQRLCSRKGALKHRLTERLAGQILIFLEKVHAA